MLKNRNTMERVVSDTITGLKPAQIVVLKRSGKWHVRWMDSDRLFTDELAAVKGAIDMAHESGRNGMPACVMLLSGKASKAKIVWTYGQDDYPPKLAGTKLTKPTNGERNRPNGELAKLEQSPRSRVGPPLETA
jgi:hypothetical protein